MRRFWWLPALALCACEATDITPGGDVSVAIDGGTDRFVAPPDPDMGGDGVLGDPCESASDCESGFCVPDGDGGWWVVGSNFGREHHPAWTGNLIAEPRATVSFEGRTTEVAAELLDDDAKAEVWPKLVAVWPAYDDYVEASGRNIRVFHLTAA